MGKHRKMGSTTKKFAALSAAAITTTALTTAIVPDSSADKSQEELLRLLADIRPFPAPGQIPDLTFGLGSAGYGLSQAVADQLIRLIVENVNLEALAKAVGLDPESLLEGLIGGLVGGIAEDTIGGVLGQAGITPVASVLLIPVLNSVLTPLFQDLLGDAAGAALGGTVAGLLAPLLGSKLNANNVGSLLAQLGLDLSSPLDLSGVDVPGLNVVTAGPLFTLLKVLGVDVGWVPALPNSVADDINDTEYLTLGLDDLLDFANLSGVLNALKALNLNLDALPDAVSLRLIPVIGVGLGAFAAGAAYQQVVDDLENQPGGENGDPSLLGSFTVLPLVLLLNPGRANGGPLARAYPFFRLLGIDTVTPETEVQSNGGYLPIKIGSLDTGLTVGGANLIPIKLDIGIQNFPASDFAAWPNPVTLANNAAALMFPTYIIRGLDATNVTTSLLQQIIRQTPGTLPTAEKGLSFNYYLTIPINGAPVLEPTYLLVDAINLLTGGSFNNPIGTALNPLLESAGNLGYTDVKRVQNSDGDWEYVRTFDDTEVPTAFGSLPDVEWGNVPGDLLNLLRVGFEQALADGIEGEPTTNALAALLGLLGLNNLTSLQSGSGLGLSGITGLAESLVGNALGSSLQSQGVETQALKTSNFDPAKVAATSTGSGQTVSLSTAVVDPGAQNTPSTDPPAATTTKERKTPVADLLRDLGNSLTPPKKTTTTGTPGETTTGTSRPAPLKDAVKQVSTEVKTTVDNVNDGLKKAADDVKKAVNDTAKKMNDAAKPKEKAAS